MASKCSEEDLANSSEYWRVYLCIGLGAAFRQTAREKEVVCAIFEASEKRSGLEIIHADLPSFFHFDIFTLRISNRYYRLSQSPIELSSAMLDESHPHTHIYMNVYKYRNKKRYNNPNVIAVFSKQFRYGYYKIR